MISRRNFIKASAMTAGALSMGSVFAESTSKVAPKIPHRFIFLRKCNGLMPKFLVPPSFSDAEKKMHDNKDSFEASLKNHELTPCLKSLEPYKENLAIIHGMSSKVCDNMHGSGVSVLGCFHRNFGIKRATVDFELARLFPTPFNSIELTPRRDATGIGAGNSAPAANRLSYCFHDPETALSEIFKSAINPGYLAESKSKYDFLKGKQMEKLKGLYGLERQKIVDTVDSINEILYRNDQLQKMSASMKKYMPVLEPYCQNLAINATYVEKIQAMTDILIGAIASGLTNVVHFNLDALNTPCTGLPGLDKYVVDIHGLGHGRSYFGFDHDQLREKIRTCHTDQIRTIVEALKKIPEGDGNMFDNTTIMYFPENGESHHGTGSESPWIVLAGKNSRLNIAGKYIRLPKLGEAGHKTLSNWYTTLLNAYGNPIEHYGDLDLEMSRKKLDQTGAIKEFLL